MTVTDIRDAVLRAVAKVAPEAKAMPLAPDVNLRDQLDLDSMDMLNLVIGIHERLGIDIPESDYARLATLDGAVSYLSDRLGAKPA